MSSSLSLRLFNRKTRQTRRRMRTIKPTAAPNVAPTIIPTLVATGRVMGHTVMTCHQSGATARGTRFSQMSQDRTGLGTSGFTTNKHANESDADALWCAVTFYVQLTISRLMKQLSDPAELLAAHTYFPDMLLLRLLSFRVPVFSSENSRHAHYSTCT